MEFFWANSLALLGTLLAKTYSAISLSHTYLLYIILSATSAKLNIIVLISQSKEPLQN